MRTEQVAITVPHCPLGGVGGGGTGGGGGGGVGGNTHVKLPGVPSSPRPVATTLRSLRSGYET